MKWRNYMSGLVKNAPQKPNELPVNPALYYKNKGWESWGEFLLTNNKPLTKNKNYISYFECKKWVWENKLFNYGITTQTIYHNWARGLISCGIKRPIFIPLAPENNI